MLVFPGTLYIPPFVQCRHRGKINIQRPCAGPLERRVFEAITQPIVLDRLEEPSKLCSRYDRLQLKPKEEEVSPKLLDKNGKILWSSTTVKPLI